MPDPSGATQAEARLVLHYGNVWQPVVDDTLTVELDIPSSSPQIGPPLFLMFAGEGRTINGQGFSFGSPGLQSFTQSSGGITGTRWIRVVNRPTTGASVNEPIQMTDAVVNDAAPSFDLEGWSGALQRGGFGGHRVQVTVHDPGNLFSGIFVEGRQVVLYAEEYEEGALISSVELFSGFVDAGARVEAGTFRRTHRFTASTIERLMGRPSMDGRLSYFVDAAFEANNGVVDDMGPIDPVTSGLLAARPFHVMNNLNVAKVISHVMFNHLWVDVGGTRFRLAELVDMRVPWWNIANGDDLAVPILAIPAGNVMQTISGFFAAQHNLVGYSFRTSDFTVAPDHEFAASMDSPVDSLSTSNAYDIWTADGPTHPCGQVRVVQSSLAQAVVGVGQVVYFPASRDSQGSIIEANVTGVFFENVAAAERMGEGIYNRANAEGDKLIFRTRGAAFDLHNLVTYAGDSWSIESVDRSGDWDWLGPVESLNVARRVG